MLDNNLDSLSLDELRDLRTRVDRAIKGYQERKRKDAIAAAEEAVRAHGFSSLADVTRARRSAKASHSSSVVRYAHPEDPNLTWSGRGRRPRWVNEYVDSGKSLEDLAV